MRRAVFVLIAIALCETTTAQTAPLTLHQAIAVALEKSPQRKEALAESRVSQTFIREARSEYFPRLSFSETAVRSNDPVFAFGTRLRQTRFTAADFALNRLNTPASIGNFATRFGLQWNVFDSFLTSASVAEAKREKTASDQRLARTDQLVVFRVVQAYYDVLLAARQVSISEHSDATSQSVMEQAHNRFDAGTTVESDFLAAQVDATGRQQELLRARNALALAKSRLNVAMEVSLDHEYELQEAGGAAAAQPPPLAEAESRALKERAELKESSARVSAREAGVQAAKSAFGPKLNVFATSELDQVNVFGNGGNNWTAGAELQFDIFSGGQKSARLARARATLEQTQAARQIAVDNIRLEIRQAWYDFDSARRTVELNRIAATQSEDALRIVENRYQVGMTTITEMLRAEDAAKSARANYWAAVYRCGTGYAALELAMGTLNSESLVVMP